MERASRKQAGHYHEIHDAYEAHYFDRTSMQYRREFFYDPMFSGIDLNGLLVADLAAGAGHNSMDLKKRYPKAATLGFDISKKACESYKQLVGAPAFELDLTLGKAVDHKVDAAIIIGGLHHCVSDLKDTLRTVASMVKPGGYFFICEPNERCFLENIRNLWYRKDKYFEATTEHSLDHDRLFAMATEWFEFDTCRYMGGPAYFLIYNSLVLRVPAWIKPLIWPPLAIMERIYNLLPGSSPFPYFVARWRRR